ncbi:hypothetical protein D3C75_1247760 [compost metagenome]
MAAVSVVAALNNIRLKLAEPEDALVIRLFWAVKLAKAPDIPFKERLDDGKGEFISHRQGYLRQSAHTL